MNYLNDIVLCVIYHVIFFFKQKTAYEMRISDWSSDVCSSDLLKALRTNTAYLQREVAHRVKVKYAAKLKFLADESFDEGTHIDTLLRNPRVARDLGEGEG